MKEKICTVVSLVLIAVITLSVFVSASIFTVDQIEEARQVQPYDGKEDYPFEEVEEQRNKADGNSNKFMRTFKVIKNGVNGLTNENFEYKMPLVLLKKSFDKLTGIDMTTSQGIHCTTTSVADLGDGRLTYIVDDFSEDDVQSLIDFGKETEQQGRNFLLFCIPYKTTEDDELKSGAFKDFSVEFEEKYKDMVEKAGLNVYSVSDAIKEQGLDKKKMFFKTDHHWLPQTALWANKLMCGYMNENFGFNIDTNIFSEENYDITYLKENWIGSQGKQVTEVYCDDEPFPVIVPKYDSDITAFVSIKDETLTGRIEDVLLDWSQFEEPNKYDRRNYDFYLYGNIALLQIHNNKLNDGRRVLLVKRSFADPMVPSLAAAVENLDVIDLRAFSGSLKDYINKTNPDTVILIYGIGEVQGEGTYDFR